MKIVILLMIAALILTSCAGFIPTKTGTTYIPQTEIDPVTGLSKEFRETAKASYIYAQLAANAYQDKQLFKTPHNIVFNSKFHNPDSDFQAVVYDIYDENKSILINRVIAYRGTIWYHWKSWWYGNLRYVHNREALEFYDEVSEMEPKVPIILAGHSLGGAMALHVSVRRNNVETYVFNSSYHYTLPNEPMKENDRYSIAERGEIVTIIRGVFYNPTAIYTPFNCKKGIGFFAHGMDQLATCLTNIAGQEVKYELAN